LIEALLLGTHAIVTEETAMAENVCRFGAGTIVPQEDSQALAQAIVAVLQNRAFGETAKVRERIIQDMGPEVVARAHNSLYESL
jgi:glycosyltransferase involved in cell wall biosynthesis